MTLSTALFLSLSLFIFTNMEDTRRLTISILSVFSCFVGLSQVGETSAQVRFDPTKTTVWFMEGQPLVITCLANTTNVNATLEIIYTMPAEMQKFKSDLTRELQPDGSMKLNLTLTYDSPSEDQSTGYICQLDGYVVHQVYAFFSVYTQGANVTEGQETQIKCDPHLQETLVIEWYKGNNPLSSLPGLQGRVVFSPDNKTVTFIDAKPSDAGVYTCRIELALESLDSMVFERNVHLQAKPYILPGAVTNVTNTSIILTCPVSGYPHPHIFWQRGKDVLTAGSNIHMTTAEGQSPAQLIITNLTDADYGTYSCIADNWIGKAEMSYQVGSGHAGANARHRVEVVVLALALLLHLNKA